MALATLEFLVVVLSLLITLAVGLYFRNVGSTSLIEYMLGSRRMDVLPISLSIAATYLTGSAMIVTAQEVYLYGTQYSVAPWNYLFFGILSAWVYLPVSYSIKSASSFEFFERRFNKIIRKFASFIFTLEIIHHTAMSQYIPAITLAQACDLPTFPIACVLSLLCVTYTASGGLKAVAWADSFQTFCFILSMIVLLIVGSVKAGGPAKIWQLLQDGARAEHFNFSTSYSSRYTVPNLYTGGMIMLAQIYLSPSYHQRVAAMPTFGSARKVVIWSAVTAFIFLLFANLIGIVMYAYFAGCDPVLAQQNVKGHSTLLPYFVNQISQSLPGLEGMFISGVLAAGLSTTTSSWNTIACTLYEDFVKPMVNRELRREVALRILMLLVVFVAIISTSFILLIEGITSLFEATITLKALTTSIHFILYNGGMFFPWLNSKGILLGSLASGMLTSYIVVGANSARKKRLVIDLPKMLTTALCKTNGTTHEYLNMTVSIGTTSYGTTTLVDPSVPWFFSISPMYFMVPGAILGVAVAFVASFMTGFENLSKVDREMIVPMMRWTLPRPVTEFPRNDESRTYTFEEVSTLKEHSSEPHNIASASRFIESHFGGEI